MFGIFKKKTEVDKLQIKYEKLMKEWHSLSTVNRSESDKKYAEAEEIAKQIDFIKTGKA
ncbi:Lacal_2735 family protein [Algibacter aquimarinus]|uniref:Lacal_2735 family protein n=1 Tax=Algibacter aquimarinus TaxID=1136748 RepID=A0ABP9HSH2_9FLAO